MSELSATMPAALAVDIAAKTDHRLPSAHVSAFGWRFVTAGLALELGLLATALTSALPAPAILLAHIGVVVGLGIAIAKRRARASNAPEDLTVPLLALIAISAAGPVGGLVGVLAAVLARRPVADGHLLAAWYERIALSTTIDSSTLMSDRIASGRVLDARAPAPEALAGVIANGSMNERQAALGLIARFFHVNYLPALSDALSSEVPVIRVQAAAVAARVRPMLAEAAARLVTRAGEAVRHTSGTGEPIECLGERLDMMRDLDLMAGSGLLDRPLADAATREARRLVATIDLLTMPLSVEPGIGARGRIDALERRLLSEGNYRGLRLLRRRTALASQGYTRLRRRKRSIVRA